jgi:hypothetical protein
MLRVALIPALAVAAGCDLVGLGSDRTVVSGVVLEDGEPVPGVEVVLLGRGGNTIVPETRSYDRDITDSRGTYRISASWEEDAWTDCGFFAVDVEAHTKSRLRLTTFDDNTRLPVNCRSDNPGKDFRFTTNLWYVGVQLGPDTLEVDSGSVMTLTGEFLRSRSAAANAVHRDSTDWVWNGSPQWDWEVRADRESYVDRTWDGCYTCDRRELLHLRRLEILGPGQIKAVLQIPNTPFADSVLILIRQGTTP